MNQEFWRGRKVFITGHTGFRGSWLALTLQNAGAQVYGFSLSPRTSPNFFELSNVGQKMTSTFGDVRDQASFQSALEYSEAEIVFHLAGGGALKDSWDDVQTVYQSQFLGTLNLLESLRMTATVRAVVVLSSDKVYRQSAEPHQESDSLGGSSPAATAKACSELLVESYLSGVFSPEKYNKHKLALATARVPAVIGGGEFALDSLVWQMAQACQAGLELPLKNPQSLRTWMHVEDLIAGLVTLAEGLVQNGPKLSGAWNFGAGVDHQATVGSFVASFAKYYGVSQHSEPLQAGSLSVHNTLNTEKASSKLQWRPQVSLEETVAKTAQWYRNYFSGVS